jgi:hypothetical protein
VTWATLPGDSIVHNDDLNGAIVASSIPAGATPTLSSFAPIPAPGDDIDATFTNPSALWAVQIEWLVNGNLHQTRNLAKGSTTDRLTTTGLASGDTVTARIRYATAADEFIGPGFPINSVIPSGTEIAAGLTNISGTPSPADGMHAKDDIIALRVPAFGAFGSESDGIQLLA